MKLTVLLGALALAAAPATTHAQPPVFTIPHAGSTVTFQVKASIPIKGRFDKWTGALAFTSPSAATGVLTMTIDANSVDTGSGLKNATLKSDQFFDVKRHPTITFRSTGLTPAGPAGAYAMAGVLTIRGVSKPVTLSLKATRHGSGGDIAGTMTFNRRDFGMNGAVPLVKIADSVDVIVHLKARRVSGPPVVG